MSHLPRTLVAIGLIWVAACGSSGSPAPSGPASGGAASTSASASGQPSASPPSSGSPGGGSTTAPGGNPNAVTVALQRVVGGLQAPLFATGAGDGSGRIFVAEQGGVIRIVKDGSLLPTPFLDISDAVSAGGERGLLGLAFAPGFGSGGNASFYLDYTNTNGDTEIAVVSARANDPDQADPASRRVLLRIAQPFANHNGGMIAFGPDGMLYIGMGDGGSEGDPMGNGQRLDTLLGKILRIDVTGGTASAPYSVPPDNPFVGQSGAKPEIWAYGMRNPWRFSFDRSSGDLWIGDVGQNAWEEIDLARAGTGAGANYGWNRMEGDHCFDPPEGCDESGLVLPVAEYSHDLGCAVIGGYVDRAADAGALSGVYVFADECSGRVWGLDSGAQGSRQPVVLADTGRTISSFGEDDAGVLYATDLARGELLKVVGQPR